MQQDVKELRDLPLEDLITAPLNAVITAQRNAAVTTMKFIEEIGLIRDDEDSFFDDPSDSTANDYDVRVAKLKVKHTPAPVPPATTSSPVEVEVEIPFISLFNVPTFEIATMEWEFNAKLKSMSSFTAAAKLSSATTVNANSNTSIGGGFIPIKIGTSMKVESTVKTDFESRFKTGREQEYNLRIKINANSAPTPKGIEKLLDIAQSIVES